MTETENETEATPTEMKFKRTNALEIPTYSLKAVKDGDVLYIRTTGEITTKPNIDRETGKQRLNKDGTESVLSLVNVVDLQGVEGEMVLPFLILKAFRLAAAKTPLIGRWFELTKIQAETGKTTKWSVYEVEAE